MQRYRFDIEGAPRPNGAREVYANWIGGPSLAGVRNCPIDLANVGPRTVYIQGEPDTWFSQPAACKIRGCYVRGFVTYDEDGPVFRPVYY